MKEAGSLLMAIGVLALIGAFFVDVSVDIGYVPSSPYLTSMPREVANLHAMHIQTLIVHGGLAAFISGIVAYGLGTVDETLRTNPPATPATDAESSESPLADQPAGDTGDNAILQVVGIIAVIAVIFLVIVNYAENSGGGSSVDYNDTVMGANEALMNAQDAINQAEADLANASR